MHYIVIAYLDNISGKVAKKEGLCFAAGHGGNEFLYMDVLVVQERGFKSCSGTKT